MWNKYTDHILIDKNEQKCISGIRRCRGPDANSDVMNENKTWDTHNKKRRIRLGKEEERLKEKRRIERTIGNIEKEWEALKNTM